MEMKNKSNGGVKKDGRNERKGEQNNLQMRTNDKELQLHLSTPVNVNANSIIFNGIKYRFPTFNMQTPSHEP